MCPHEGGVVSRGCWRISCRGSYFFRPVIFFKRHGYHVHCTALLSSFDQVVEESDACVLYYWWHGKWKLGAHFVALHKKENCIIGYNTYRTSKGPDVYGVSLQKFLKERKYFGCVLIGIKSNEECAIFNPQLLKM